MSTSNDTNQTIQPNKMVIKEGSFTHQRIVQNFLIVWLDSTIDEFNVECRNAVTQLRRVANAIRLFTDANQCIDYVTEILNERVFMIISGADEHFLVSCVHDIGQLDSIYIFCSNKFEHEPWTKEWSKVKGVFTQIDSVCESLEEAVRQCDQDLTTFSFIPPRDVTNKNLDQLDHSFMYTQLFKEVFLEVEFDEQAIQDFTTYCRDQYADNDGQLKKINEFEREYHNRTPIWWYTCDCFLYSMLNRALRTLEVYTIMKMGFFYQRSSQTHQTASFESS